jgi:hypothetical protein
MCEIERLRRYRRNLHRAAALGSTIGIVAACSPEILVGNGSLPSNLSDPANTRTSAGAMSAYRGTLAQFRGALGGNIGSSGVGSYVAMSGLLSDELQSAAIGAIGGTGLGMDLDSRSLPEFSRMDLEGTNDSYVATYSALQKVRGQAREAMGLLHDYVPVGSKPLDAHLYALSGYSEVLLAELFCSGVPLSTLNYNGDYTLAAGSSTEEVLVDAGALFDTALTLAGDSARFMNLARVGKARSLLGLGQPTAAAQAVVDVPDDFLYEVSYSSTTGFAATNFAEVPSVGWNYTESDREGGNGLAFRTSGDARTSATAIGTTMFNVTLYHPDKYSTDGSSSIVLASGVEARLIEAEAALHAGDVPTWLAKLNHLRETAITPALADTADPGTPDARIDLLFRERAFWLFLTGQRQGDLRRLVRQYGRNSEQVYPSGTYLGAGGFYGTDVTAPIPAAEQFGNPKSTGCFSRRA